MPKQVSEIAEIAEHFNFNIARIGTTGGDRLEIAVYGDAIHLVFSYRTAGTLVEVFGSSPS